MDEKASEDPVPTDATGEPEADRTALDGAPGTDTEERIPLARERVRVEKREVERVAAKIKLRTHEEDARVAETLRREQIDIERVPVDRVVDDVPVTRTEGDVTVIPIVEEVLVKRFRVIEEIRLRPRFEAHEVAETVRLRRQVATVDAAPDDAASADGAATADTNATGSAVPSRRGG